MSTYLFENGYNILDAGQFDDEGTGRFFMRVVFNSVRTMSIWMRWKAGFEAIAERFQHELADAFARGKAPGDAAGVEIRPLPRGPDLSLAHRRNADGSRRDHLEPSPSDLRTYRSRRRPVPPSAGHADTKLEQETQIWESAQGTKTDLVVLARYMQVLSDGLAAKLTGRCINIHHSFLPGFKGAKPYHQAHERGVKLIGATAHYVTSDLDEGPIIEQDVERITHRATPGGSRPQGARHRAPGAGPGAAQASRGPGAAEREADGGVFGLTAIKPRIMVARISVRRVRRSVP